MNVLLGAGTARRPTRSRSPGQGVANWSGPYLDSGELPKDGWGNAFVYIPAPEGGQPQVESLGSDGKPGGTGNAADLIK